MSTLLSKTVVLGAALLMAMSAFATNSGDLQISRPVTVAGKQLTAGDYSLNWAGNGPSVALKILKGRTVVATTPAHIVPLDRPTASGGSVRKNNSDGTESLSQILFGGKKYALAIDDQNSVGVQQGTH